MIIKCKEFVLSFIKFFLICYFFWNKSEIHVSENVYEIWMIHMKIIKFEDSVDKIEAKLFLNIKGTSIWIQVFQ